MALDERVFLGAKRYDRRALEALLETVYPTVHRMASGLTGRDDVARGVLRFVMNRALDQIPSWRDADAAERWFYHHTLLTTRRAEKHQPAAGDDVLVLRAGGADPAYTAFVRALRGLPAQQREAFILHYGERFNTRYLGVAMDCSTRAAEQHLDAAREALRELTGDALDALAARLGKAYSELTPPEEWTRPSVQKYVRHGLWPRRLRKALRVILAVVVSAGVAYFGWKYRHLLPWESLGEGT